MNAVKCLKFVVALLFM